MPKTLSKAAVMTAPDLVESTDQSSAGATINLPPKVIYEAGKVEEGGIAVLQSIGDNRFSGKTSSCKP